MHQIPLPTPWNLYRLSSSPFFQETLEGVLPSPRPLSLFIGRQMELRQLKNTIFGAGERSSRQAIAGQPGVGKTTLVQELKSELLRSGYLATDALVPILADDTSEALFGRVLGVLYDTILANRPNTVESEAMKDARQLVRTARLGTGGGGFSVMGVGVNASRGVVALTPGDLLIDGPRVLRDLMSLVQSSDARGIVLHLNNLENLSEADARRAAEVLRSLRDPMLMHNGLHAVLVGTTDSVSTVINTHAQVRTVFSTLLLEPLSTADVNQMLEARYRFLAVDDAPIAPVEDDAVAALYALFRGDLRGLLKALEDGVTPLLGLTGTSDDAEPRPLTLAEIRPVLKLRYQAHLASLPEQTRVKQLSQWGEKAPDSIQTQKTLGKLWNVTQGTVSNAVSYLIQQGYVTALPRQAGELMQYALSGTSRLIFG